MPSVDVDAEVGWYKRSGTISFSLNRGVNPTPQDGTSSEHSKPEVKNRFSKDSDSHWTCCILAKTQNKKGG